VHIFVTTMMCLAMAVGFYFQSSAKQPEVEEVIREIDAAWSEALKNKDLDQVMTNYAEDASFLPPDEPIVRGQGKIRQWFEKRIALPGYSASFAPTTIVTSQSSDMAYELGTFRVTVDDATGKPVVYSGKHLVAWRKLGGHWKVVAESINRDSGSIPN
jgi:ketosteroid isomerase-like protein